MKTWLNGQPANQISVSDRGLSYGDGLFETIQIRSGRPLLLADHWRRLQTGLARLKFPESTLPLLQSDLASLELPEAGVLKLIVTRGPGGRGYRLPDETAVSRIVALAPLPEFVSDPAEKGIRVRLCETRLGFNPLLAGIKHLNRLEQVLARSEWDAPEIAEGIVADLEGYLVEGTMSNLFWVKQGVLYTPLLDRCGVAGIVRDRLIDIAGREGVEVVEGRFTTDSLFEADEVFVCNSLINIWPVVAIDESHYQVGEMTRRLQGWLQQEYIA